MRKINTNDVFKLARIIKAGKMQDNISHALEDMAENPSKNIKLSEKAGIRVLIAIFESCGENGVEDKMYELLGGIAEVDPTSIGKQPFNDTLNMVKEIAKENDLAAFFKQASKLI